MTQPNPISPPSRSSLLREFLGLKEIPRLLIHARVLLKQQRGSGQPILVLPGFGMGDASTMVLRAYLRYLGYQVRGWDLGINSGNVPELLPQVIQAVESFSKKAQDKICLIGWSLGGYLGREAARERPELIKQVIMLGSPVIGGPKYTLAANFYRRKGFDLDALEAEVEQRNQTPLLIPITSIYSRSDGVVAWEACIDSSSKQTEHIEVSTSHVGLGFSPEVYKFIAQCLVAKAKPA